MPLRKQGKKTLVLDLDETLIHSQFKPVPDADIVVKIDISQIQNQVLYQKVYALKRPFCDEFLKAVAPLFEIVMFTASMQQYAEPIFKKLDPKGKLIDHYLYREHCTQHSRDMFVKDLTRLGRPIEDIIILDNSPNSYAFTPQNAIPCISWYEDMADDELSQLIPVFQKLARFKGDVRRILRKIAPYKPGVALNTVKANKRLERVLAQQALHEQNSMNEKQQHLELITEEIQNAMLSSKVESLGDGTALAGTKKKGIVPEHVKSE